MTYRLPRVMGCPACRRLPGKQTTWPASGLITSPVDSKRVPPPSKADRGLSATVRDRWALSECGGRKDCPGGGRMVRS
jgi:hypothetical protein